MGSGTFRAGQFNLIVSLRHNANAARLAEWRASFEQASSLLFDATDGQHQIGTVYVCNNSSGGHNADAWLLDVDGTSFSSVHAMGNDTLHMTLCADERFKPFVIIHEFGHYGYGLWDEYTGPGGSAECIGGNTADACIMESGWWDGDRFGNDATGGALVSGRVSEFCVASNHDPDSDTNQDDINGEACWQTMVDNYPDLDLPVDLPVVAGGAAAALNWIELLAEQRFVLVVDRSGSMTGNKLTEACFGADWWADNAVIGDRLAIVSYSHTVTSDFPLTEITGNPDRIDAQNAISGIHAGGTTSIGGGLREGLNQILAAGARAATQVIVLLTDGLQNTGEYPATVLPDLVANGVRVYTLGIGDSIDEVLLQNIATTTGGTFSRIDPALPMADQEFQIRTNLQEISGIARDNGGLVTTIPERTEPREVTYKVWIEPGSEMATFAISWKNIEDLLFLELHSPSGISINLGTTGGGIRQIYSQRPYMGFQVKKPETGEWLLIIKPEKIARLMEFKTFVFSQNPCIDGGLFSPWRQYNPGNTIPLYLQVYFNRPLTGLKVQGTAQLPDGRKLPIEFCDTGRKDLGSLRPNIGVFSNLFKEARKPGVYTFDVSVESDGKTVAYAKVGERLGKDEVYQYEPIPAFHRHFTYSVRVGDQRRKTIQIKPDRGYPGEELLIQIQGRYTHFQSPYTVASFGEGIRVGEVQVTDKETAQVPVFISKKARFGPREVYIRTPVYREAVEGDNAFVVGHHISIIPRGKIDRLVYDRLGRFIGIRMTGQTEVIAAPIELEASVKEAFSAGHNITLIADPDTGELKHIEIG